MKKLYIVLILTAFYATVKAQQDPIYTHYMYNTLSVNPAYAGSRDVMTANLIHRAQWVTFPGAPVTQSLTLHSPVKGGVNLGLAVTNDAIGLEKSTSVAFSYAYRFNITEESRLAFGLSVGFNYMNPNLNQLLTIQPGDPAFNIESKLMPNVGFGMYYSLDRFYAGFSIPRLYENTYTYTSSGNTDQLNVEEREYVFIAGGMITLNDYWGLKPTGLIKVTEGSPVQTDLSAQLVYNNKFDFGLMYRSDLNILQSPTTGDGVGFLAGVNLTDNLYLGYSFDYSFANPTRFANLGTHELVLRYDFVYKNKSKIISPRYF